MIRPAGGSPGDAAASAAGPADSGAEPARTGLRGPAQGDTRRRPRGDLAAAEPTPGSRLQARIAELEDQRLRALADLDNLRKRCAPGRARARRRPGPRWQAVAAGRRQPRAGAGARRADPARHHRRVPGRPATRPGCPAALGFPRRDDLGALFDPSRHEAIGSRAATAAPAGTVVRGPAACYGEPDRQLRPAQVVVAKDGLMASGDRDFYEILGVRRIATQEQIQRAYRKLAREHHPDVNKDPGAEDRFKDSPRPTTSCPIRRPGAATTRSARISGRCPRTWIPRRSGAAAPGGNRGAGEARGAGVPAGSARAWAATWAASI